MNQLAELGNLTSALPEECPFPRLGGADGNQTHDLLIANEALYQLSYRPKPKGTGYERVPRSK